MEGELPGILNAGDWLNQVTALLHVRETALQSPDPYGQNCAVYSKCLDSMAEAIPSLVAYLKKEYKRKIQ